MVNNVEATPRRSHARTVVLVRLAFILGLGALLAGASRSGSLSLDLGLPFAVLGVLWALTLLAWSGTRFGASVPVLLGGQIALDLIFGTLLIGASGGTRSPLVLLPVVSILMAGAFLGRRAALLTAGGAWLGWGGIAWFIGDGAPLPAAHAIWLICAYGGAFVLLALLTGAQAERARRSESEVADASAELKRQAQSNERLLEFMPIGLMTVANDGAIARLNRAATDLLGRPAEDPIGANAADFLAALSPALVDALESSLVTQKWATREEVVLPGDDGDDRWLGVAFTPLIQADETQEGVLITFSDLSPVRRMEDQMWRAEQLAKLGELAAGVAHEIRNPLASISGAIQVLGETSRDGEDRELMDLIMRESDRLNRTIDGVLDYTRDHSGSHSFHDISQTVREVVRLLRHDRGLNLGKTILLELPEDQSFLARVEEGGMKQVFLNLARNALQAMDLGGILRISGQVQDGRISVVFKDSGSGIPAHELEQIFKPFHTTKAKGTGLGLSIASRIIEGNGGTIRAKSTPGVGSAFTVELPCVPQGSTRGGLAPKTEEDPHPIEAHP